MSGLIIAAVVLVAASAPACTKIDRRMRIADWVGLQEAAWNRGDIDGFMKFYKKSDDITFSSGGQTRRGWNATRSYFKSRYNTREKMGKLTFSDLEVTPLGETHLLILGRWKLERENPVKGNFTLVVDETHEPPEIIHDHTSVDDPK